MGRAKEVAICGLLLALALALSYVERLIPVPLPLPGIKLGLANVVTLLALYLFRKRYALSILLCRCFLGAVFGGGITGLVFSLCGGLLAFFVMAAAKKAPVFSIFGVSILGAAAHNLGQIGAAMVLMESVYVAGYLPWLLLVAVVTGWMTGGSCAGILRVLPKTGLQLPAGMQNKEGLS